MPLPAELVVHPDRNMIEFRDEEHDGYDPDFASSPRHGNLQSNTYQACLYTIQTLEPVILHFATAAPGDTSIGYASLAMPTGMLVISEVTRGAHGPFPLDDGPGLYEIRIYPHPDSTATPLVDDHQAGAEHYVVTMHRTGEWATEDDN